VHGLKSRLLANRKILISLLEATDPAPLSSDRFRFFEFTERRISEQSFQKEIYDEQVSFRI
jgi:hypothetical protein